VLKFEIRAMCAQLDLEVMCKRSKIRKDHLIFINFGVKKFTIKNIQKNQNFDVWILLSPRYHGMKSWNFLRLRLIFNKVTSRSYGYFLKFAYFYFLRNWFFQLRQKLRSLVKKSQEILGVNPLCPRVVMWILRFCRVSVLRVANLRAWWWH
jgi:hypothetical protein